MADVENSKHFNEKSSSSDAQYGEYSHAEGVGEIQTETRRGLNSRHIQFLALGTQLFPKMSTL
jgi:amino acid permease